MCEKGNILGLRTSPPAKPPVQVSYLRNDPASSCNFVRDEKDPSGKVLLF